MSEGAFISRETERWVSRHVNSIGRNLRLRDVKGTEIQRGGVFGSISF